MEDKQREEQAPYKNYQAHINLFYHDMAVRDNRLDDNTFKEFEKNVINSNFTDQQKLSLLGDVGMAKELNTTFTTHDKRMEEVQHIMNKTVSYLCKKSINSTRKKQRSKKRVTSVAIHDDNQELIDQLQQEAKVCGFVLSKEVIINTALRCFGDKVASESFITLMCDVLK